ncbi:OLC1v1004525C1 [Oldenlandia corymbosa var. corymbosa]|uniref:OLC1v1004525C1 n=1 Tax=Oldenlandia corymbosa var. corymbosa TaxID=529605 RepID=A0AAV1DCH3_OLDCO|nr:OLC1v1004525C1 [Oldenlandia corymbosa var. corymbosa]
MDPSCLELSLPDSELADAFDLASKLSAQRAISPSPFAWKLKRMFNYGSERKLKEAIKMVDSLAEGVIKQKRQQNGTTFSAQNDLLSRFMSNIDDDKYLRDIVDQEDRGEETAAMDVDSQPTMEETILVGEDLMLGPPSPIIPPEIASHVLEGVDLCDGILRNLFLCLQIKDIEPFCQDEIALYRECAERRDKELRKRLQDSESKLGMSMPLKEVTERATQLESEVTSLERRLILASGVEGIEGFRQRWSLHGRLTDTK